MPFGLPLVPRDTFGIPAQDINIPEGFDIEGLPRRQPVRRVQRRDVPPEFDLGDFADLVLGGGVQLKDVTGYAETPGVAEPVPAAPTPVTPVTVPGLAYQRQAQTTPAAQAATDQNTTARAALDLTKKGLGLAKEFLPKTPGTAQTRSPSIEQAYQEQRAGERADYSTPATPGSFDISSAIEPYTLGGAALIAPQIGPALVTPELGASLPTLPGFDQPLSFGAGFDFGGLDLGDLGTNLSLWTPNFEMPAPAAYTLGATPGLDLGDLAATSAAGDTAAAAGGGFWGSIPYIQAAQELATIAQNALSGMPAGQQAVHAALGLVPFFGSALTSLVDKFLYGGGDYIPTRINDALALKQATTEAPWLISAASTPEELASAVREAGGDRTPVGRYGDRGFEPFDPSWLADPNSLSLNWGGTHLSGLETADTALTNLVRRQAYLINVEQQLAPVAESAGMSIPDLLRSAGQEGLAAAFDARTMAKQRLQQYRQGQSIIGRPPDPYAPDAYLQELRSLPPEVLNHLLDVTGLRATWPDDNLPTSPDIEPAPDYSAAWQAGGAG